MFFPFKTKNPPESPPIATLGLIGLNVVVYLATSNGLAIKRSVVDNFALTHANVGPVTLFSSLFLHGNILHILGNMWFLWLMGAAVEGRLKTFKFLLLYFAAGLTGDALHLMTSINQPDAPSLGASGAIMGLLGAALWMFPHNKMKIWYFFNFWWHGVWEWRMWGVALYYLVWDDLLPLLLGIKDGTAHFAHLGGAAGGFLVALMLRAKRDDLELSDAKSELSDSSSLESLNRHELQKLAISQPDNPDVALAWIVRSMDYGKRPDPDCVTHFLKHCRVCAREGDIGQVGAVVFGLSDAAGQVPAQTLFDVGMRLEQEARPQLAVPVLERALAAPDCNDSIAEGALFRLGMIQEAWFQNYVGALAHFEALQSRFPMSPMEPQVRERIRVVGPKALAQPQN